MKKQQTGIAIGSPYGVIPETFSDPVSITPEQETILYGLSAIHRDIANQMIVECLYRFDLAYRKKQANAGNPDVTICDHECDYDTRTTAFSLNYVLGEMKKHPFFKHVNQIRLQDARGTALYVSGAFESYRQLRKKGDAAARKPRVCSEKMFQTIVWQNVSLRANRVQLVHMTGGSKKILEIEIPRATAAKICGREIVHAKIVRKVKDMGQPSSYSIEMVCHQNAPEPALLKRCAGIDAGAGGVAAIDSRGHKTWANMRRPDKFWMPKILKCDAELKTLRDTGCQETNYFQELSKRCRSMFKKMQAQQNDYQRKLAANIIQKADVFFVGEEKVRLGLAQSNDGVSKEHRSVQNTGSISRFIQYLKWNARKTGKLVIMVPDAAIDERDYKTRKILAARQHLLQGMASPEFEKAVSEHNAVWISGQAVLGIIHKTIPPERGAICSEKNVLAVSKIVQKTTEQLKTVRIERASKPFLTHRL